MTKDSILADAKNLLYILHPAIPADAEDRTYRRCGRDERAVQNIIRTSSPKECPGGKARRHPRDVGEFGSCWQTFELCIAQGLLTDSDKLAYRRTVGTYRGRCRKWRNASRSLKRQEQSQVGQQ